MRPASRLLAVVLSLFTTTVALAADGDCVSMAASGLRPIASERDQRFLGKVQKDTAGCRGGEKAVEYRALPWIDWGNYYATGDSTSRARTLLSWFPHLGANGRGLDGALLDLELQRIELVKFNLLDNSGTYEEHIRGRDGVGGPALKVWSSMRLPKDDPNYAAVGGDAQQLCSGSLIRFRTLTGICNDIRNPAMGSTGMLFARNSQFEATFPDLGKNEIAKNRHGDRLAMLRPDPQLISRMLFTRDDATSHDCNHGLGLPDFSTSADCDYAKAPFFNVLAAFWIQFMTHDWFSHLDEGQNDVRQMVKTGCATKIVDGREVPLTPEEIAKLGCRPNDVIDRAFVADESEPGKFSHGGREYLNRAYRTMRNHNTAWWDASQIYGYDETSRKRVKRDENDRAKLSMPNGYLPSLQPNDPQLAQWRGQEATGFPDNWTIGMSFYTNLFAREHNAFVDEFRRLQKATPDADSGVRNPENPDAVITYRNVSDDELFEIARLVVSASIAKIHTIEWTPQLLYNEPLYQAMNANWNGLFADSATLKRISSKVVQRLSESKDPRDATEWYSVFASGAGIFGTGSKKYSGDLGRKDVWSLKNPDDVNGGVNHFGSPFNFPEEFVTVYRLHPLVPDLIEYRDYKAPNAIQQKVTLMATLRGKATDQMRERGIANWALSMGRQRLGLLTLGNHPRFLQNLPMPRLEQSETKMIDVVALDLMRDRERGVPRFNEFRRQYGLKQLTRFDDFIDPAATGAELERQKTFVAKLREIYGQHKCDVKKSPITTAQRNEDGSPINDCLGFPDGTMVDNIEDVDTVVGWLAEFRRPHGFAISETQFQVFILNASRRLFSDRFFTSSFRPEFYSHAGVNWVSNNGPGPKQHEAKKQNGHKVEVSPLKRVLMRNIPELQSELLTVVNAFDPWARDRGQYYSIAWTPRPGAETDPAFPRQSNEQLTKNQN